MKTSAKYFCLAVGPRSVCLAVGPSSQKWPKPTLLNTYDVTHKKMKPKTKTFFFIAGLKTFQVF